MADAIVFRERLIGDKTMVSRIGGFAMNSTLMNLAAGFGAGVLVMLLAIWTWLWRTEDRAKGLADRHLRAARQVKDDD